MTNIVPPQGYSSWSWFTPDSFTAGEMGSIYAGRLQRAEGREPVLYFHGASQDPVTMQEQMWQPLIAAYAGLGHPVVVPELGGQSRWATPAVVGAGGFVDQAITWAGLPSSPGVSGVRTDKLLLHGASMGTLNAMAWAYRLPNPAKIRAITLVGPIVNFEEFYNDNPVFQGPIDADWGTHGAWLAGLPTSDPWRNIANIRPFGHKIRLFYATDDEFIDPATVLAFAELVGAEAIAVDTEHLGLFTVSPIDQIVSGALRIATDRRRAYVGWDAVDWNRFDHRVLTQPAVVADRNLNTRDTIEAVGGRRGEFVRLAGTNGNERFAELLREVSAPDLSIKALWHNGDGGLQAGQHGNIPKGHIDTVAGTYNLYMTWSDIFFGIPWLINQAVWSGHVDVDDLTLLGLAGGPIPGLRLSAGGPVLASSRASNVVTLVVDKADADRSFRSGILDIAMTGPLGNYTGTATRLDDQHLQYTLAGANVTSGGPGSWADFGSCFPYHADTELFSTTMRSRFYRIDQDPPAWNDHNWSISWQDTGAWGYRGYGNPGLMFGHVGINKPGQRAFLQVGAFAVEEL